MGDQLGPGIHNVRECSMLEFADLGDIDGFQEPGSGVYGMLLSKGGYYVPTSVQPEEPEWEVKLTIRHPHINLRPGEGGISSYLGNRGRMLVSYSPSGKAKAQAVLESLSSFYILRTKADTNTNIPDKATVTFSKDLNTLTTRQAEAAPKKCIEVLPEPKLQWDALMLIALIIKDNKVRAMSPALRTQLGDKGVRTIIFLY